MSDNGESKLTLSTVQVLNDLYLIHHYLTLYTNKIAQAAEDPDHVSIFPPKILVICFLAKFFLK